MRWVKDFWVLPRRSGRREEQCWVVPRGSQLHPLDTATAARGFPQNNLQQQGGSGVKVTSKHPTRGTFVFQRRAQPLEVSVRHGSV